mmetsp:Transcript_24664/g.30754  ORF Transcript_24664/g.30754 Transcript_24664/m.30754 type:complete len:197 (+) Transcript_24664:1334-1924(+)|eukprot:CAMPEP_0170454320 /NCGR_PEP_ID=MMETSP0123-20130129/2616_1 /TAXON_ID=182087 /ORGANISM="Favella ehrenbergii, Strain Fehren 1" /LENGTH=196 /DNA_ID=CAMNT_0010717003 /DNA_START=1996 /DNA_END=2586 /DNA_ORIENTATION=-
MLLARAQGGTARVRSKLGVSTQVNLTIKVETSRFLKEVKNSGKKSKNDFMQYALIREDVQSSGKQSTVDESKDQQQKEQLKDVLGGKVQDKAEMQPIEYETPMRRFKSSASLNSHDSKKDKITRSNKVKPTDDLAPDDSSLSASQRDLLMSPKPDPLPVSNEEAEAEGKKGSHQDRMAGAGDELEDLIDHDDKAES